MAYQTKPGQGAIFKNEKRTSDKSPHYYGSVVAPDGKEWDVSLWLTEAKSGQRYFSVAVKEPYRKDAPPATQSAPPPADVDDDLPF
jgi:hypothetical protein